MQLSEQRELTDEENEQATLALFAWYFLGYGSPDDAVSQSGLLGNIISGITGVGDFSREDIAYTIIYSLYGSPDHWGDAAPFNYLSNVGIAGLLLTIRNDGTTSKNHLYNIYERLGSVISYLSSIRDYSDGNYKRLGGINDTAAQMNERLGSQLGYVSNIRDYSKGAYDRLGTIMDALYQNGTTEAAYSEGIYKRLGTIMDALYQNGTTEAAYSEGIYKRLGTVMDLLTRIADKDYSASLDADLTPVTDRLDEIARLLSPSGQSSLLDSFLGDFTMPVSSALSAQVQAAMQSAFPFCIPAILKQVLGLMEVDPSAASIEFDILGATCTLDLSAGGFASGIATVTSWLCRILFALVLIVSTPRFVFALPGRGS